MSMEAIIWQELKRIQVSCEEKTFLKAIEIWLQKPHVVNRRLAGAVILHRQRMHACSLKHAIDETLSTSPDRILDVSSKALDENNSSNSSSDGSLSATGENPGQGIFGEEQDKVKDVNEISRFELCLRKLVPRQMRSGSTEKALKELIIIDHKESTATFVALLHDEETREMHDNVPTNAYMFQTAYRIIYSSKASRISLQTSEEYHEPESPSFAVTCPTKAWLQDSLLPKIAKWASEVSADATVRTSQALVSMERYSALYGELKKKYGAKFVKIWPETTDPLKFVYEDVAIATYLLVLWEQERAEIGLGCLQSFVDLGCGNGLLVHILNSEGHPGKGIDLRRRKIWDLYGPGTNLDECSITPSNDFLFPDYDWLIGNHSDELTPWIPIMAARSSYTTRYFVLPCCFHDFDVKFMKRDHTNTQYRDYLNYIQEVGLVSGFKVQEDTLRIPSTKRICQIGSHRNYQQEQSEEVHKDITTFITSRRRHRNSPAITQQTGTTPEHSIISKDMNFIDHAGDTTGTSIQSLESNISKVQTASMDKDDRNVHIAQGVDFCSSHSRNSQATGWAPEFQPREKIEPVRNCAKVDYDLKQRITNEVARAILSEDGGDSTDVLRGAKAMKVWRRGGSLTFAEIAKLFDSDVLRQLKSECGGLKTLLKNSHQVFEVSSNKVEIRDWLTFMPDKETVSKKHKRKANDRMNCFKTRLCWFDVHHPDGCPRLASDCQFAHGEGELKNLTISTKVEGSIN